MSPRGMRLNQQIVKDLSQCGDIVILCGHYEGVDQRVIDMDIDMDMICTIPSGRTVSLCLHGYSVSSEKQTAAIFEVKGTLELYDCKGGGSVSSTATGATGSTVCAYDGARSHYME